MNWKADLKQFEKDNYSGSAALLEQYIEQLFFWLEQGALQTAKDRSHLRENLSRLQRKHDSLFVLLHFYERAMKVLDQESADWHEDLLEFIQQYRLTWTRINTRLAGQALKVLDLKHKTILSHSQSSAVRETFSLYPGSKKKIRIYQTESRPVLEGRSQASALHRLGYDVVLITDVGYTRHLDQINMILLGADAVYRDYFVNKSGTYGICLAGKEAGIPIYVLADRRKFWFNLPDRWQETQYKEESKPGLEVWELPDPGLKVENYYFEKTPSSWIDGFIAESEVLKSAEIEKSRT